MNRVQPILIAAACVLVLSARASVSEVQRDRAPAPVVTTQPQSGGLIQPTAADAPALGAVNAGGTRATRRISAFAAKPTSHRQRSALYASFK